MVCQITVVMKVTRTYHHHAGLSSVFQSNKQKVDLSCHWASSFQQVLQATHQCCLDAGTCLESSQQPCRLAELLSDPPACQYEPVHRIPSTRCILQKKKSARCNLMLLIAFMQVSCLALACQI